MDPVIEWLLRNLGIIGLIIICVFIIWYSYYRPIFISKRKEEHIAKRQKEVLDHKLEIERKIKENRRNLENGKREQNIKGGLSDDRSKKLHSTIVGLYERLERAKGAFSALMHPLQSVPRGMTLEDVDIENRKAANMAWVNLVSYIPSARLYLTSKAENLLNEIEKEFNRAMADYKVNLLIKTRDEGKAAMFSLKGWERVYEVITPLLEELKDEFKDALGSGNT